jgi:ABC-type nitrate/sulfonate/bicarbonate transport system substrate-binding protein
MLPAITDALTIVVVEEDRDRAIAIVDALKASGDCEVHVIGNVTPPPQMPATMEAGTIYGYAMGEPWSRQAVFKGIGAPVITDYQLWKTNPEKVFGITNDLAEDNPNNHQGRREGPDPRRDVAGRK